VGLLVSISFFSSSRNFLCWILRFAFRWLCTLISSQIRRLSTNSMRALMDGVHGFSGSFSDFFFRLNVLTCEHCSTFGLKANLSFYLLMLSWIFPAPTSMCAFAILKNGLPNMRGVLVSTSMSRTMKSSGTKKFYIFTRIFLAIPAG
jgi:hypothetical protein